MFVSGAVEAERILCLAELIARVAVVAGCHQMVNLTKERGCWLLLVLRQRVNFS